MWVVLVQTSDELEKYLANANVRPAKTILERSRKILEFRFHERLDALALKKALRKNSKYPPYAFWSV
jgi:hypothetical protein